jgi:predicted amidohydrolase YtcJ
MSNHRSRALIVVAATSCLLVAATSCLLRPAIAIGASCPADLILHNGHVVTMDRARSVVTSLAIRDGKVVITGDAKTVDACKGPASQVLDLHQQTVLPGLIDVHTHGIWWATTVVRGDIDAKYPGVRAIADIARAVAARVATAAPNAWVQGAGWDDSKLADHRYLTKRDLDPSSPRKSSTNTVFS